MSCYLLFHRGRLVQAHEQGTNYGSVPPLQVFEKPEGGEWDAAEVSPEVLMEIRPPVWGALVTHCRILRREGERLAVQVDHHEDILERIRQNAVEAVESRLLSSAMALGSLRIGIDQLRAFGFPEARMASRLDRAEDEVKTALTDLEDLDSRVVTPRVPQVLLDWAGGVVPL